MSRGTLLVHADLLFTAKIREVAAADPSGVSVRPVRDVAALQRAIDEGGALELIVDLNSSRVDPFELLQAAVQQGISGPLAFYSHVDEDLRTRALEISGVECVRRSQFARAVQDRVVHLRARTQTS